MELEDFRAEATDWLPANRGAPPPPHRPPPPAPAPRDYGAILPPDMRDEGMAWQARLFTAGYAGIHWPVEHGGRGLTPEHNAAWTEACALASVPPFINMVGIVLAGGSLQLFGTPDQQTEHLRPII